MPSINDSVATLIDKVQPPAPRPKNPALPDGMSLPKSAPVKQKAAPGSSRGMLRRGVSGEQRRDRRTVRTVQTDNGTIVVTLQPGTGPLARGLDMLSDALGSGVDGFPVRVVQGGKIVASQTKPTAPAALVKVAPPVGGKVA